MAPRNRGKGKKGGKQKKKKNVAENEVEEKYRKAALEVDILKEHLALRRDVARQVKADSEGLKQRQLERELEMSRDDKKDIYEATCREAIQQARAEREQVLGEKDRTITELQGKIDAMETEYEKILHGSLDRVLSKLAAAQGCWEKEATAMHMEHKERLREFGLNPLEI
ncbi:dynein regulatory complex protein 12 [Lepidochelys kempii]|uniref:dynein regulatory complex protein 12 n=1 Tax=Lepidochelys kempii TaxID=8472 RepID=UPI003C6EF261